MKVCRRVLVSVMLLLSAAAGAAACGQGDSPTFTPPDSGSSVDGPEHIHGLGINPADGSLMIATHSGLFRSAPGSESAARVGDRRQDTMGFTVIGRDRFLGSGHPDLRDDLPPLLGLIRSDDAGRTWQPVSLLGKVDFHILRTAGTRIYGVDAGTGRLLVSDDGGRRWAARTPPTPLVDIAAAPRDPDHVVAAGAGGVFASRDAGARWRPMDRDRIGLLAWPSRDALYLVDTRGRVYTSGDAARTWSNVGDVGGQPAALASYRSELYVALHTNEVKMSTDGGRSWRTRVAP